MSKLKTYAVYVGVLWGFLGAFALGILYQGAGQDVPLVANARPALSNRGAFFLRESFREYHLAPPSGPFRVRNALSLAEVLYKEHLHQLALKRYQNGGDKTLSPVLPDMEVKYDQVFRVDPGKAELSLPRQPRFYSYEIRNRSGKTVQGPILYKKYLWNSVPGLLKTAGFGAIPGELDRAKAIYEFLLQYHLHDYSPSEGDEEDDVVKYLAQYGYGLCDEAAGVEAALLRAVGLRARVWGLSGHVVTEAFAGGKWRLFDPDLRTYFYANADKRAVYGVEDLSTHRKYFDNYVSDLWSKDLPYPETDKGIFLSTGDNNISDDLPVSTTTVLSYRLRPGEKMVFTNFNWGKPYLPIFHPQPLKRYYNGYFEYTVKPMEMQVDRSIDISGTGDGLELSNESSGETSYARLEFSSPFPIVGGEISVIVRKKTGEPYFMIFDRDGGKDLSFALGKNRNAFNWTTSFDTRQTGPVFYYVLGIKMPPGSRLRLSKLSVRTEFQFGRLPLLELLKGDNRFHAYFPQGSRPEQFESSFFVKY